MVNEGFTLFKSSNVGNGCLSSQKEFISLPCKGLPEKKHDPKTMFSINTILINN